MKERDLNGTSIWRNGRPPGFTEFADADEAAERLRVDKILEKVSENPKLIGKAKLAFKRHGLNLELLHPDKTGK